jgi:hypothetical protein
LIRRDESPLRQLSHEAKDLKAIDYYVALDDHKQTKAMKHVLQAFHLVYSADGYRVMEWGSDLIEPVFCYGNSSLVELA